jgi:hypothetical protein
MCVSMVCFVLLGARRELLLLLLLLLLFAVELLLVLDAPYQVQLVLVQGRRQQARSPALDRAEDRGHGLRPRYIYRAPHRLRRRYIGVIQRPRAVEFVGQDDIRQRPLDAMPPGPGRQRDWSRRLHRISGRHCRWLDRTSKKGTPFLVQASCMHALSTKS